MLGVAPEVGLCRSWPRARAVCSGAQSLKAMPPKACRSVSSRRSWAAAPTPSLQLRHRPSRALAKGFGFCCPGLRAMLATPCFRICARPEPWPRTRVTQKGRQGWRERPLSRQIRPMRAWAHMRSRALCAASALQPTALGARERRAKPREGRHQIGPIAFHGRVGRPARAGSPQGALSCVIASQRCPEKSPTSRHS